MITTVTWVLIRYYIADLQHKTTAVFAHCVLRDSASLWAAMGMPCNDLGKVLRPREVWFSLGRDGHACMSDFQDSIAVTKRGP